jgi:hypothetical protein
MTLKDTAKLDSSLREVAELASADEAPVEFRFDASNVDGVNFHEVDVLIPEHEEEARNILGERLTLKLGLGDDVVFLSGGPGGDELLQECRNGSAQGELAAMEMNLHLLPLLRFIAKVQDTPELGTVIESLPESSEDQIRMTMNIIENGQSVRFEMQDGVLEIFGKIGQSMGGMAPPMEDF